MIRIIAAPAFLVRRWLGAATTKRKAQFATFAGRVELGHGERCSITQRGQLAIAALCGGFHPKSGYPLSTSG
jgi:hypothetical protein